jgi:hypothetical protein
VLAVVVVVAAQVEQHQAAVEQEVQELALMEQVTQVVEVVEVDLIPQLVLAVQA